MMKNSTLIILEIIWITTGILSTGAFIRSLINDGGSRVIIFALMALVSFSFALFRHNQRKKN